MKVYELLKKIKITKRKINELRREIKRTQSDAITTVLLSEMDQLQNYTIALNKSNEKTKTKIGQTEASISALVSIRDNTQKKIIFLTELINLEEKELDILSLIEQRDNLYEEFITIDKVIRLSDLETEIE